MSKQKSSSVEQLSQFENLAQINLNAAGLDIGDTEIWVCVPSDRAEQPVRCFNTFTADLHTLADWLTQAGIETVAMESTGIYWIPLYEILDARGFEVNLVNAHHLKNVPGRKSDVQDCQRPLCETARTEGAHLFKVRPLLPRVRGLLSL